MLLKACAMVFAFIFSFFSFGVALAKPLHIVLGDNYGKHAMLIDGEASGIQKDLLHWFFEDYMKINVIIESVPWKRAQALVEKSKQSDGYFTTYTRSRLEDLNLQASKKPFYTTFVKMHTWRGNPNTLAVSQLKTVDDLTQLKSLRHVFLQGSGYHEDQFNNAKYIDRLNNIHHIAKFLLVYKRADLFVEQSELFYPIAEELGLIDEVLTLDNIKFNRLDWHLYIHKESKHAGLMNVINAHIDKAISEGILQAKVEEIFKKYNLNYTK